MCYSWEGNHMVDLDGVEVRQRNEAGENANKTRSTWNI